MQATRLSKSFGSRDLFQDVSFRIDPGDRLAVVGDNGTGKSTLLRILAGELSPDGGEVSRVNGEVIALHDQRPPRDAGLKLGDYIAQGQSAARAAEARLSELESRMADGDASEDILRDYERAQAALERAGGYAWRSWTERVMRGLGIPAEWSGREISGLSGGELTRAALARTLVARPDVLLLDEPTNHLDIASVTWLEEVIPELGAATIVVSHDRWFLESISTGVLEVEAGRARHWPMGYSRYRRERALARKRESAEAARQAAEIARLERFVERWSAGTKARQAQARKKQLEKMEPPAAPTREKAMAFGFPRAERSVRVVVDADGLDVVAGDKPLVSSGSFGVERGWRVALVGPNGSGKTTLMETILGRRAPARGRVSLGSRVSPAYFSQHGAELDDQRTLLETVLAGSSLNQTGARTLLGNFLFGARDVDRRVESLSGGERARLALVRLIAGGGNLLALDEPTNHLDIAGREALEEALMAYDGTILMISHDRALIDTIATHTLSIEDGGVVLRGGNYSDFLAQTSEADAAPEPPAAPGKKASRGGKRTADGGRQRKRTRTRTSTRPSRRAVEGLEKQISDLETEIARLEGELADPAVTADPARVGELGDRHRDLQQELSWKMRDWEAAAEAAG